MIDAILLVFNNDISRKKFASIFKPWTRLNCPDCNKTKVDGLNETTHDKYKMVTKIVNKRHKMVNIGGKHKMVRKHDMVNIRW